VPKDAKKKLKTTAFGHVSNVPVPQAPTKISPEELKQVEEKPIEPVAPTKLMMEEKKDQAPIAPTKVIKAESQKNLEKPQVPPAPHFDKIDTKLEVIEKIKHETIKEPKKFDEVRASSNKKELEDSLMDLKIKKAKLQKMALDFEMQELSGEITSEELKEKKEKLNTLEKKINDQIQEVEQFLNDLKK
jgi:hypothetical protein